MSRYKSWQTASELRERVVRVRVTRRFKIMVDVDRLPSRCHSGQSRFDTAPRRHACRRSLQPAEIRGIPIRSRARQPSDVGSIGLSGLRTPGGLVGTTAPGSNSGMPGSQSSRAACSSASTLAEDISRLALPIQPQVQRAWFLRRSRTTTTTPRPPVESPIVAKSPPSVVSCSPGCSAEPWPPPPYCRL